MARSVTRRTIRGWPELRPFLVIFLLALLGVVWALGGLW